MPDPAADLHPLDRATRLAGDPASRRRTATVDGSYWTFIGPFGGTTAATLVRAVLEDPERDGDPLAVTVNYCAPVAKGTLDVAVRLARRNRSSQHWILEATQGDDPAPVVTATVVTAVRRESWSHATAAAPALPDPESLPLLDRPGALEWVKRYRMRFAEGLMQPAAGGEGAVHVPPRSPRSVLWLQDAEPRPLDAVALTAMSDAFFGRLFQVIGRLPPFGTVTLTTHFHASAAELAEQGTEPLACVADAHVFHRSYGDQSAELWSRSGRLLATTTQMAYFKV
jgi:acyl-CoA thioesterase